MTDTLAPTVTKTVYIVVDYDQYADLSWLDQDCYDPRSPEFQGTWHTKEEMDSGKPQIDPDWYRDHDNHVNFVMTAYDADDEVVDCCGGIDFLVTSDEYTVGTFHRIARLPDGYLREMAREMGLPE